MQMLTFEEVGLRKEPSEIGNFTAIVLSIKTM
jgi:hypothetical protein